MEYDVNKYTPNPISKILITILLGFTVIHPLNIFYNWLIVIFISFMFLINGKRKEFIKSIVMYLFLVNFLSFKDLSNLNPFLKIFLSFFFLAKMFYLPFLAGKYFIKTSDVGSIITSMDKLKIPSSFSIPIAVMFRFFPSFIEEKNNIKLTMKIRGISVKNPLKYMEYILTPLLILSSNITDDIAKAAETKCISNPIKKTRYRTVNFNIIDIIYIFIIIILFLLGGSFI